MLASLPPERRRLLAAALVIVGVLVLGLPRLVHHGTPARAAAPPLRAARATARAAPQLVIDVAGAVRRPGLYHLPQGDRVADAVAAAGGETVHADAVAVNLAAPLADGEQVVVPARGIGATAKSGASNAPVDLNSAGAEQLDALPGIGPATAAKIVAYRQQHGAFHSLAELDGVPGIGQAKIAQLKGLVVPP